MCRCRWIVKGQSPSKKCDSITLRIQFRESMSRLRAVLVVNLALLKHANPGDVQVVACSLPWFEPDHTFEFHGDKPL